ncbi:MAG: hypothetical protein Solivirus5_18 [Solivirus sp.]|uniref:Uncharacterized protein n=1 Tax=Solivirus sp. TaxID=2487772 RepID=A0A3G5AFY0_9VIRU|nr:MAG: hypothetical protein Solivirus5_18 [Solivirus sp.]
MEEYITFPMMQDLWDKTNHVIKSLNFSEKWEYEENDDHGGGMCFSYNCEYCGYYSMKLDITGIYVYGSGKYCKMTLDKFDITTVQNIITKTLPDFKWPTLKSK